MARRRINPIISVQSMSTGRAVQPTEFVDDFTGEIVHVAQPAHVDKPLPSAQALLDQDNLRKAAAQRAILADFPTLTRSAARVVARGAMVRRFTKS